MSTIEGDLELICVPPHKTRQLWPAVLPMIDAAFAAFDVPVPIDILEQLEAGTRLLWIAIAPKNEIRAAMLSQLFDMRSGKVCKVLECGGEKMHSWLPLRTHIENFAKREGCGRVIIEGRPGWARLLPEYKLIGVTLEKRI